MNQLEKFSKGSLINYIIKEKKNGYGIVILICGRQRSGKSMSALAIAESLKLKNISKFHIETNLMVLVEDLVKRHLEKESFNQTYILDESETKLNAQEFWNDFNLAFEKIISSQMYKGNIYIVILPMAIRLSKSNRRYVDIKIEMVKRRFAKWSFLIKNYGELGFKANKPAIREYYIPRILEMPKLDDDLVQKYKKIEIRDKEGIVKDIAKKLGLLEDTTIHVDKNDKIEFRINHD